MVKTLTNIDGSKVIAAIKATKPVTATGKVAVENFSKFIGQNRLTAIGLEQALVAFESLRADTGLDKLIGTLRGLMPAVNRQVACTYEIIANEDKAVFLAASPEAEQKVAELYKYNAAKIIDKLVNGELDAFATNPAIAQLIRYAKSARADQVATSSSDILVTTGDVGMTIEPIINVQYLSAGMLMYVDGMLLLAGNRGQIDLVSDLSDYDDLQPQVRKLLSMLQYVKVGDEPNVLTANDDLAEILSKNFSISKLEFDLLATNDAFIGINGTFMDFDKAKAILDANRPEVLASTLLNAEAKAGLDTMLDLMSTLLDFRGAILSNRYAKKFSADNISFYVLKLGNYYNLIVRQNGAVVTNIKSYNDVMSMLADEFVTTNVPVFNAMQNAYAADIDAATHKLNVRVKLATDLANDISKLDALYKEISAEIETVGSMSDANPEKIKALNSLKQRTEEKLEAAKAELEKLA